MNATTWLRDLEARGVHVEARGDRLRYRGPREVLTPDTIQALRAHKHALLALLAATCSWCHERPGNGGIDPVGEPWCVRCRDSERAGQLEGLGLAMAEGSNWVRAWRGAARELGEIAAWPQLSFPADRPVMSGAAAWEAFTAFASVPDLQLVVRALRAVVADLPGPEQGERGSTGFCERCHRELPETGGS